MFFLRGTKWEYKIIGEDKQESFRGLIIFGPFLGAGPILFGVKCSQTEVGKILDYLKSLETCIIFQKE